MLAYYFRVALSQLGRYRAQSILAVLGVAIGVANIILLISITDLGKRQTTEFMNDLGASLVFITPFVNMENGSLESFSHTQATEFIPLKTVAAVRATPGIDVAVPIVMFPGHAGYQAKRCFTTLEGVSSEFLKVRNERVADGRWFSAAEDSGRAKVVVLGDAVRAQLFGEGRAVGKSIVIHGARYEVAGVLAYKGRIGLEDIDNRIYLPLSTAQQLFKYDGVQAVLASYNSSINGDTAVERIKQSLTKLLKPGETLDDAYSVFTVKEARQLMDSTLGIFRAVLLGIACIALLVAGIGIMNVMLMRVLNRRMEIGVRRAAGATQRQILAQFLVESVLQALLGAAFGIALGMAGVVAYCRFAKWEPFFSPGTMLLAVAFSAATGILSGVYPAWRGAKLDPIRCLRE